MMPGATSGVVPIPKHVVITGALMMAQMISRVHYKIGSDATVSWTNLSRCPATQGP